MNGKLSFPTSVFLEEKFTKAQPVPGYLKVRDMEMILKYLAENKNKTMPWSKYQSEFKPAWK
jgi:thioredoxin-related protein